ncbi:phosphotransferase family protein [Mycolicibacterium vinylchloridicum]|uniref:phosphotransferase family protein n=1 Tax=Mycolicibacterium vinylchloridicum TaxID=2736928 RepID=UPI0015C74550|nr:phosphotransferase family protein [Mycolicibacterium vinylchloridicum]
MTAPDPVSDSGLTTSELDRVADWLRREGVLSGDIENVEAIGGGTQNILVGVVCDGKHLVLRRPPRNKRAGSDKAMLREIQILRALADSEVPHARVRAACNDQDVIGSVFYLQDRVDGVNLAEKFPTHYLTDLDLQFQIGLSLVDALLTVGRTAINTDAFAGLGRPEGWIERQVRRWHGQLHEYAGGKSYAAGQLPHAERVAAWLNAHLPPRWEPGLMHGDYHAANVMFDPAQPVVAAIVDWELATIGDPLVDLAHLAITWPSLDRSSGRDITGARGLATASELIARYARGTDRDMSHFEWYMVFARFRLGILLEGTYARACDGKADVATGARLHDHAIRLLTDAFAAIDRAEVLM